MASAVHPQAPDAGGARPRARGRRTGFGGLRPLFYQLFSYALVGLSNVAVTLVVLNGLVFYRGIEGGSALLGANVVAVGLAIVNSYVWNSLFTFRSGALLHGSLFARFLAVSLAGFVVNQAVFAATVYPLLATGHFGPNLASTLAQVLAISVQFIVNFAGLRMWAYRVAPQPVGAPPLLAAGQWRPAAALDVELATVAAGERWLGALRRGRPWLAAYGAVTGALLAFGWYSSSYLGMNNGDGTARVSQAFAAVFSRDPHLGTLSLIWPPIPALVDIPLVILLRPFGQAFMAGAVMGALFMAGATLLLYRVLREVGAGRALAIALAAAFLTQPHVYQSAAAGLSEAPFAFFLLGSLLAYLRWMRTAGSGALVVAGLLAAGATMSRYEGMFWVGAQALGVVLLTSGHVPFFTAFTAGRGADSPARAPAGAATASLIAYLVPFGFVLAMWMWVNIQIKGDPLFFLTGPGSTRTAPDTAKVFGSDFPLYYAYHSVGGTLELAVSRILKLSPLLALSTGVLAVHVLRRRDLETVVLGALAWSVIAFPVVTGYMGSLPPWVRYWYWLAPMGLVLATHGLGRIRGPGTRTLLTAVVVVLAFVPNVRVFMDTYHGFPNATVPFTAAERLRNALLTTEDLSSVPARQAAVEEYRAVAAVLDEQVPADMLVLLDVIGPGGPIPMFSAFPQRLVTTTDQDFEENFLYRPWEAVDYLLVPFPTFDHESRSIVLQSHDGIWDGALPWAELVTEIEGPTRWRLFRMRPGASAGDRGGAAPDRRE